MAAVIKFDGHEFAHLDGISENLHDEAHIIYHGIINNKRIADCRPGIFSAIEKKEIKHFIFNANSRLLGNLFQWSRRRISFFRGGERKIIKVSTSLKSTRKISSPRNSFFYLFENFRHLDEEIVVNHTSILIFDRMELGYLNSNTGNKLWPG